MTREEVLKRLCKLCTEVSEKEFEWSTASDCFCGEKGEDYTHFRLDEDVLDFITSAVHEKLYKKKSRKNSIEDILDRYISLCNIETEIDDPDMIELSILLDNHFGHDSGDRTQVSWIPIVKNSFEYAIKDDESEIVYNSDKYSIIVSPNFDWNGYIYVKENS